MCGANMLDQVGVYSPTRNEKVALASHADVLRGSSRVGQERVTNP